MRYALESVRCPTCGYRQDLRGVAREDMISEGTTVACSAKVVRDGAGRIVPENEVERQAIVRNDPNRSTPGKNEYDYIPPSERDPVAVVRGGHRLPIQRFRVHECGGEMTITSVEPTVIVTVERASRSGSAG